MSRRRQLNPRSYWFIDDGGCNEEFKTLSDAKNHFSFYSKRNRIASNGVQILHIVDDDVVSSVEVRCTKDGVVSFGRVISDKNLWSRFTFR